MPQPKPAREFIAASYWTRFFPFSVSTNFSGSAVITRFVFLIKSRMFCPFRSFLTISDAAVIVLIEYIFLIFFHGASFVKRQFVMKT